MNSRLLALLVAFVVAAPGVAIAGQGRRALPVGGSE